MTIDEAIEYADLMSRNVNAFEGAKQIYEFGMICAGALRLKKKMSEENGLTEETEDVCSEPQDMEYPDCWRARMEREYRETEERYEKLNRLLVKHAAGTLDFTLKCPIELLKAQREHMSDYLYTLEIRAEIEGVNLYD